MKKKASNRSVSTQSPLFVSHLCGDEVERRAHCGLGLLNREARRVGGGPGDVLYGGARDDSRMHASSHAADVAGRREEGTRSGVLGHSRGQGSPEDESLHLLQIRLERRKDEKVERRNNGKKEGRSEEE